MPDGSGRTQLIEADKMAPRAQRAPESARGRHVDRRRRAAPAWPRSQRRRCRARSPRRASGRPQPR